jgi:hypothetical protein
LLHHHRLLRVLLHHRLHRLHHRSAIVPTIAGMVRTIPVVRGKPASC